MPGTRTAFFYGTLMVPQILYRVCLGRSEVTNDKAKANLAANLSIKHAILHNYCRHKVVFADYPGIVAEEGHTVRGTYVTGLTSRDIKHLDIFEGGEYCRTKVKVVLMRLDSNEELIETKNEVETETYVYTAGLSSLESAEWDFEEFRREKLHRWVDTSHEYDEVDEQAADGHDPTGGRGVRSASSTKLNDGDETEILQSAV